ncbi:Uu.00g053610.m01.CDS01 [Anthostomella pinea]|uniref:Uu.00g053610.m01.CDS01 n=1 Tax=Anthostomella pinea TaxID=933095 RepID=A0AAI8VWH4_9PEZI|nr:Uu.00g053610.m01.CDS01 [Anthostomella pinea]
MSYSLTTHYAGQGLLDSFSFFTGSDSSNGFVDYQSREAAVASNLVSIDEFNRVRLGVDSVNTYSTSDKGRPSVRLTSNDDFTHGLFIADFAHMPGSACGTWPAFWAFNNQEARTLVSLGPKDRPIAHPLLEISAGNYASPTSDSASYGDAFNAEGGGVYALEWDSEDLKIWHFPRSTIPDDITYAPVVKPDPASWGPPQAVFGGPGCDADLYFFNLSLVINTNFCGDYAGNVWGKADQCNQLAPTCTEYVAANPGNSKSAFWDINYIDIYQLGAAATDPTIPPVFPNITSAPSSATSLPSLNGTVPGSNGTFTPSVTRTVTRSTITQVMTTAEPTKTSGGLIDPSMLYGYTLLGCFGSSAGYQSFTPVASFATMDNEACVTNCAGRKFAGVSGEDCYCADILGDASAVDNDLCDILCLGNPREFCGGLLDYTPSNSTVNGTLQGNFTLSVRHHDRRATPSKILLTVYGDLRVDATPPGAPAMGGGEPLPSTTPAANVTVTSAITVTYTTVCATNPAELIVLQYCTTVTYEECATATATAAPSITAAPSNNNATTTTPDAALAAVPMTTCTQTCDACGPGGASTVALTVPDAVATVVPVSNVTLAALSQSQNGTTLSPSSVPVLAGAPTMGVATAMGWGLGLWVGLFGVLVMV